MEITKGLSTLAARTAVIISVLVQAVAAQGLYLGATILSFWPGPSYSPTLETGLLILGILTAIMARARPLGIVMSVWALLLLIWVNA